MKSTVYPAGQEICVICDICPYLRSDSFFVSTASASASARETVRRAPATQAKRPRAAGYQTMNWASVAQIANKPNAMAVAVR
jgi:hypothetical protein